MGDLQDEVEIFGRGPIFGVGVFQSEPSVFLDIESFIFNFPSDPSSLVGDPSDVGRIEVEVGNPFELSDSVSLRSSVLGLE